MRTLLGRPRGLVEKKLFGGVGFMVHGNMACGVNKEDLIVRLSPHDFEAALRLPHVRVFDIGGRPMQGWVLISPGGYVSKTALRNWIKKSLSFAKSLPAK
jgi:hypothetical protein